jgi:phospholipid/cholesterol/gamma-HCH transport system substrate-binding protein
MKVETKVGLLALGAVALMVVFAYMMGLISPFSNARTLNITYN